MHTRFRAAFPALVFEVVLLFALMPHAARAAGPTHVSGPISGGAWDAARSPYLLDSDAIVPSGSRLIISAGASVALAPGAASSSLIVSPGAALSIEGTAGAPVSVAGIDRIYIDGSSDASIAGARLSGGTSLVLHQSHARISSTTISGANGPALYAWGSSVDASGMRIEKSGSDPLVLVTPDMVTGAQPDVSIRHSSFIGPGVYVADNSGAVARLEEDWWGSDADPASVPGNFIQGRVSYAPWLSYDPTAARVAALGAPSCCSSVLFIPGLEGTRLYSGGDRLWEPVSDAQVRRLFLRPDGTSVDPAVRAEEPIGRAYGAKGIYGSFMSFLDGLKSSGKIADWKAFGYDWRMPADQVASSAGLEEALRSLASTSLTGKVAIVAHSNGGLVAKSFIRRIDAIGATRLIDSVISVAVPYLGTPQAIAALLHGDGQSIMGGLFMSRAAARSLGANMPSAYGLLPSAAFFEKLLMPAIAYASTTDAVSDGAAFRAFMESMGGNRLLMSAAEAAHALLDPYPWPVSVASWALVGVGRATPQAIRYSLRQGCDAPVAVLWCWGSKLVHAALLTLNGDGTVVAGSASHGSERSIAVDLSEQSVSHADMLESSSTQSLIAGIIANEASSTPMPLVPEIPMITVRSSPLLEIEARDGAGRRTGLRADGSYQTDIPGSSMEADLGQDGQGSSISLPGSRGRYALSGKGVGFGFFSVAVERSQAGRLLDSVEYELAPASPLTAASTTIDSGAPLASSSPLEVDVDGDGSAEREALIGGNGMPGNATSTEEAARIGREESLELLRETDTDALRDDPRRTELIERLFPSGGLPGSGMPTTLAPAPAASSSPETKPPAQGAGGCER